MAFNVQSFSTLSSSGNSQSVVLQDGTIIGSPGEYAYISASDTLDDIMATDYFAQVAYILQANSVIKATGSDLSAELVVVTSTQGPPPSVTVTTGGAAGGDVEGPASSTDNAVALYDGTTGKQIQNSLVVVSDVGAMSGLTMLTVDNLRFDGNTITSIDAGGSITLLPNTTGVINFGATASSGIETRYFEDTDNGTNYVGVKAPNSLAASLTYTWPSTGPTADGQALVATTTGVMSWSDAGSSYRLITYVGHGFLTGDVLYLNGATLTLARADNVATAEVVGIVVSVPSADTFIMQFGGWVQNLTGLTAGLVYYLSPSSAGDLTSTKPSTAGQVIKPLLVADSTTTGYWINQLGVAL